MKAKVLVHVFGNDEPGLVESIAELVKANQGNWLESRLSHLGGRFVGLVLCEFEKAQLNDAITAFNEFKLAGLELKAEACDIEPLTANAQVTLVGNDKPGIIHEISQCLKSLNANVEKLESAVEAAPMSGGSLFKASLEVHLPEAVELSDLQQALEGIANDLMVDIEVN
ncbi:glycine cleavage system protein R [Pleionea sp. CnH1-48]|uniref:glycine cleavage system protein R n=1 Tax=Pleionea sp. CnH1-48 TaxID=2954494 RepID=UPI00209735C3|nr:ACT domain-containing protein [Pleionea sp. CnH1-48]MCO7225164.1 glycine cleavage system protein R [Pleionea sp. CnH1-48]